MIIPNLVASYNFRALWADEDALMTLPDREAYGFGRHPRIVLSKDARTATCRKSASFARRSNIRSIRWMTYRAQQKGIELLAGTDSPLPRPCTPAGRCRLSSGCWLRPA